ncbi:MAG: TM0106 family RecB-like putative nuclease, partial [candidate division NC10 bacterium]|nr:TM0106 family RecB-like putative nuclease [candidate division NC10 bacterium]
LALEQMAAGVLALAGPPLLYIPEGLAGRPDLLERVEGIASRLGPYAYRVVEIKSARHLDAADLVQAAFYNALLGKIQGVELPSVTLINRDGQAFEHAMEELRPRLAEALEGTRAILAGRVVPEPIHGGCPWPWTAFADAQAAARQDLSLLPGVGKATRETLRAAGLRTLGDVAAAEVAALAGLPRITAGKVLALRAAASALRTGRPVRIHPGSLPLPHAPVEIFVDLEGAEAADAAGDPIPFDYLIGTLTRQRGEGLYRPFLATSPAEEGRMAAEFVAFCETWPDAPLYHWHSYERSHLKTLFERYGIAAGRAAALLDRLTDLHRLATRAVAFPVPGTGLKPVANALGFSWRLPGVDALESIVLFLEYTSDPTRHAGALARILTYNEDDCRATAFVKDWLAALA